MIKDFVSLRQAAGSNSCLPTAVQAILLFYGETILQETVSEWCEERRLGCPLGMAMAGLQDHELTVTELSGDVEDEIRYRVNDLDEPVLVTIQNPRVSSSGDHAVVVVGIDSVVVDGQKKEYVYFMDPITGEIEKELSDRFWPMWDFAGGWAAVIDPT